jgi:hypothetical protein
MLTDKESIGEMLRRVADGIYSAAERLWPEGMEDDDESLGLTLYRVADVEQVLLKASSELLQQLVYLGGLMEKIRAEEIKTKAAPKKKKARKK